MNILTQWPLAESISIKAALDAGCQFLRHGVDPKLVAMGQDARVDAQALMCHVLAVNPTYLYTWPEKHLSPEQRNSYEQLIVARNAGEPVAYLTGSRGFWTLELKTAPSTLIPRADTECLVEQVLALMPQTEAKILDLGTGTGAIALAIASEKPKWVIHGCDYNKDAVILAQQNALANSELIDIEQVNFVHSDWFSYYRDKQIKDFDLIVSNPPYIAPDDEHLTQGDLVYEPLTALVAKDQGYRDLFDIIAQASVFLKPGGWLMLEHGFEQGPKVAQCFIEHGYLKVQTLKDYSDNDRYTLARI